MHSFMTFGYLFLICSVGVAQGVITGIRGLCNGLGPALFGFIFYLFHVDLNDADSVPTPPGTNKTPNIDDGHIAMLHHIHEVSVATMVEMKLRRTLRI